MVWPLGAGADVSTETERPVALFGEAGASLMRLSAARLPVPPGFVISAEVCAFYARSGGRFPPGLWDQIRQQLARLERSIVSERDRTRRPLLLRVRIEEVQRRAGEIPPAMVIGFSERAAEQLADATGRAAPGWRGWARLLRVYGARIWQTAADALDEARGRLLRRYRVASETALNAEGSRELCAELRRILWERVRQTVPVELEEQFRGVLAWAYERWTHASRRGEMSPTCRFGVPVVATLAVLSDLDEGSVACAVWSRDPILGSATVWGRLLVDDTQPPDASVGLPLATLASARDPQLRVAYGQIRRLTQHAEQLAGWPQLLEYVVESGRLWMVGALPAKAAPAVTLQWAVDLARLNRRAGGGPARHVLLRLAPDDLRWHPRAPTAARRIRQKVLEWCRENRRLGVFSFQVEARPPVTPDVSACDGVVWHPSEASDSLESGQDVWSSLDHLVSRHRGRPITMVLPMEWFTKGGTVRPGETAGADVSRFAQLLPLLRRAVRARWNPRLAWAVPAGDLESPTLDSLHVLREEVRQIASAVGPRLSMETGVAVEWPRALLALGCVGELAEFAVLDLDRLDAALRGVQFCGETDGHRPFDAEGLGVLLESGVRRMRESHPRFRFIAALRGLPSPGLLRFCLRLGLNAIAVPEDRVAPAGLAAAQASVRLDVGDSGC